MDKDPSNDANSWLEPEAVEVPINGQLDLHNFHPRDCKDLIHHYLDECAARGIASVRVIHGKGTGALRQGVWHHLANHAAIDAFDFAPRERGGDGATEVKLG